MANRHTSLPKNFPTLYRRLEEIILGNSGEDEFEEIINLLVIKLTSTQPPSLVQDADKALQVIAERWPGVISSPCVKLTQEQYSKAMEALSSLTLLNEDLESIDAVFEYVVNRKKKGDKGQFFTPRNVVDFCINSMNLTNAASVADPAAGSGGFIYRAAKVVDESCKLWAFDFDEIAVRTAKLLMHVSKTENYTIKNVNSLRKPSTLTPFPESNVDTTVIEDYLRMLGGPSSFDAILTNPPFAGEVNDADILCGYDLAKIKSRAERDLLFIERCLDLLKPGGRLSIILPDSVFGRASNIGVRNWILSKARVIGVIGLPRETFMPHTSVKTSILFLEKRSCPRVEDERIFFAISEKVGKDSRGNQIFRENNGLQELDDDFAEIEEKFEQFRHEEGVNW